MEHGFKDTFSNNKGKLSKNPVNYESTPYDERSSCFSNVGTYHGVGKAQPIGSRMEKNTSEMLPMKSKCVMDQSNRKYDDKKVNLPK